jgi:asparagine synthase (glutamine-hydrolysing)
MFRYVAMTWDAADRSACSAAADMTNVFAQCQGWNSVLARPGLQVFVAGARVDIDQTYALAEGRGLILGHLFGHDAWLIKADHFSTRSGESAEIVRTEGRHLVDRYWGRYIAFIEGRNAGLRVLRDPTGALPCFLIRHRDVDITFSWLEDLLERLPSLPTPPVDRASLAAHIALGELTGRRTTLEGVSQVMPGEIVALSGGALAAQPLWSPSARARAEPIDDVESACRTLRWTVQRCVQSWAQVYPAIVLRLSGGLDSSILASCLAAGQTQTPVTCLNYHSAGADSDERYYARLAAQRASRELVELERSDDFRLEQVLDLALTPRIFSYAGRFNSRTDAEVARMTGSPALFTGAGGDQLFFEFQRWWPGADYLRRQGIDRGLSGALLNAARLGRVSLWHVVRQAVAEVLRRDLPAPLFDRPWSLATESVWATREDPRRFEHPSAADAVSLPIGKLMQVRQLLHVAGYYDPWQRAAAPELVHPLLSQPLMELCLRIPTYVLTQGGRARGLARQAFLGDLPPEIVRRRSKGGLQEILHAILARNLGFVRELLLDGELARNGLIDRRRTELALSSHPGAGSVRPGEIHMFVAVEAWLRRRSALQSLRG